MKQFHGMSLYLAFSMFWLATGAIAGEAGTAANPPTVTQEKAAAKRFTRVSFSFKGEDCQEV